MAVGVLAPLPDLALSAAAADRAIDLLPHFDDSAVTGTVVGLQTNLSAPYDLAFFELFDRAGPGRTRTTPVTVENFLRYADEGRYDNTFVHRSVPGFVIQGGGFKLAAGLPHIDTFAPIVNEFGTSNTRGTIAMAKVGGNANSATSEWFVNLADNNDPEDPLSLDNQNGGFTVFGRVLGSGMSLFDGIASLPRHDIRAAFQNGALSDTPLLSQQAPPLPADYQFSVNDFVYFPAVRRVGELIYVASSSDSSIVAAAIGADGKLQLSLPRGGVGTAVITVRASSIFNPTDFAEDTFSVSRAAPAAPNGLIGLGSDNTVRIGESTGSQFASSLLATLPAGTWSNFLTGDFNDDGRDDFAARNASGEWRVGLTPATGTATPSVWGSWSSGIDWQSVMVGDFDGDGRADIVGRNPTDGSWQVARSTGSAFTNASFGDWSTATAWASIMTGDFNGDGKTDVVGRNPADGSWQVATSTGSSFTSSRFGSWQTSIQWNSILTGDFDGDGKTDIAGRASSGAWRVSRSTGTAFVNSQFGPWNASITWADVVTGDFDGDGKTDIAGRNAATGHWNVSRSTGTAFVTTRFGFWTADIPWAAIVVGDFDGDGKSDIAGRNTSNGAWRVARSDGARFTTLAFSTWPKTVTWTTVRGVRI
jgi:cyclophilin family peptidyl-prolyl cis-trans isomerase